MKHLIPAPEWLQQRMESVRKAPPPTLERVERQARASAAFRAKLTGKPSGYPGEHGEVKQMGPEAETTSSPTRQGG